MDTSKVSFVVDGDWKHDHLYFKEMIDRWARRDGRHLFKIDSHEIGDSGSDWYKAQYDIYIAKDEQSLDRLNSMRRLFANESLNKKPMREGESFMRESIIEPRFTRDEMVEIASKAEARSGNPDYKRIMIKFDNVLQGRARHVKLNINEKDLIWYMFEGTKDEDKYTKKLYRA